MTIIALFAAMVIESDEGMLYSITKSYLSFIPYV